MADNKLPVVSKSEYKFPSTQQKEKIDDYIERKSLSLRVSDLMKQAKVYLKPGEKPPKGVRVQRGKRGGMFYSPSAKIKATIEKPKTEYKPSDYLKAAKEAAHKVYSIDDRTAAYYATRFISSLGKPPFKGSMTPNKVHDLFLEREYGKGWETEFTPRVRHGKEKSSEQAVVENKPDLTIPHLPKIFHKKIIDGKIYIRISSSRDPEAAKKQAQSLKANKKVVKILKETKKDNQGKEYTVHAVYKLQKGVLPPSGHEPPKHKTTMPYLIARKHPLFPKFLSAEGLFSLSGNYPSSQSMKNRLALHDRAVNAMASNSKEAEKYVNEYIKYAKRHR